MSEALTTRNTDDGATSGEGFHAQGSRGRVGVWNMGKTNVLQHEKGPAGKGKHAGVLGQMWW